MSEPNQERKEQYRKVRSDFDELEIEDKALFLLEATVSTLVRGIEQFGRVVSDQFNDAFRGYGASKPGEPTPEPPVAPTDGPVGGTA